ncbi:MAG: ABC transporter ATP-binding protein [Acidimicrobiia bacterium]
MGDNVILRCDHLVKVYDSPTGRVQAVRGVDLEIEAGSLSAVVGPSGSGKSSLLRMLAGLDRPTAGLVTVDGIDLNALRPGRRARTRAGLLTHVHQNPTDNLLSHLTAGQQLWRIARPRSDAGRVTSEALEALGLASRRDHTPSELSGGECQRLAFARAAVAGHRLVIADEPTAQLEGSSTTATLAAMSHLTAQGVTVLVATHDPRLLAQVDQVVTLRDGAVASVSSAGTELAVIDGSGRLQLPPDIRQRFPERRARVSWDEGAGHMVVERP